MASAHTLSFPSASVTLPPLGAASPLSLPPHLTLSHPGPVPSARLKAENGGIREERELVLLFQPLSSLWVKLVLQNPQMCPGCAPASRLGWPVFLHGWLSSPPHCPPRSLVCPWGGWGRRGWGRGP